MAGWIGHAGLKLDADNYIAAFEQSQLGYNVVSKEIMTADGITAIPNHHANVREEDGMYLGLTSNRYGVIQNEMAFSLMQPFDALGIHYVRGGMTDGGMCFMVGYLQDENILGDDFRTYVLAMNSFNGRFPLGIMITPTRIVCENMFRGLLGSGKDSMFTLRHGRNIADMVASMDAESLREKVGGFYIDFIANVEQLAGQKVAPSALDDVLDIIYPMKNEDGVVDIKKYNRNRERREQWIHDYYQVDDNQNFIGTKYGILNAYYDYLSHPEKHGVSREGYSSRRYESLMAGDAVDNKVLKVIRAA